MGTASPTSDPADGATTTRRDAPGLASRVATLVGLGPATAYLAVVDPSEGGLWPPCPSRAVLGLDCPGCGGLRGTHDLLRGDIVSALDHNLLLPFALLALAVMLVLWLLPLVGRPVRRLRLPRGAAVAALVTVTVFAVLRNLPVAALEFLGSS